MSAVACPRFWSATAFQSVRGLSATGPEKSRLYFLSGFLPRTNASASCTPLTGNAPETRPTGRPSSAVERTQPGGHCSCPGSGILLLELHSLEDEVADAAPGAEGVVVVEHVVD